MPKARSRKADEPIEEPSKAWLDSYADAMTLLLAFFILLYASSLIDEDKFIEFKVGVADALGNPSPVIDGGTGVLDAGNGIASMVTAPPSLEATTDGSEDKTENADNAAETDELEEFLANVDEVTPENAEQLVEELQRRIDEVGATDFVEIVNDPRGVIIRFDSQVLFRSGEAKILPDGVIVLQAVSEALRSIDNLLVVEGHTDDVPTDGTRWPTNWELSATRATTVLRFLTDLESVPPVRISAAGYADTRPRANNRTPEGRAENRRVELVVVVAPYNEQLTDVEDVPAASAADSAIPDPRVEPDPVDILDLSPEPVDPAG